MKYLALVFALLLAPLAQAADAIIHLDAPGQTLYVRVFETSTGSVAAALTEGTSAGVGRYVVTDATLAAAGLDGSATYAYKVFSGAPSTTADDPLVGVGSVRWASTLAIDPVGDLADGARLDLLVDAIKLVTDRVGGMLQLDGALYEFTPAAVEEAPGSSGVTIPVNQIAVPDSRRWIVKRKTSGALRGELPVSCSIGEPDIYSIDFAGDLPTNGRLESFDEIEIETGTALGVTFDSANQDVDKTEAKVEITGVTAGTYVLKATATKQAAFGGGTAIARVILIVEDE